MNVLNDVRVIIYRCHNKGLEILLDSTSRADKLDEWIVPASAISKFKNSIELDLITDTDGNSLQYLAVEADSHEVPSIKALVRHDVDLVSKKVKKKLGFSHVNYCHIKDAIKKSLPHEHKILRELKEVITDRNSVVGI